MYRHEFVQKIFLCGVLTFCQMTLCAQQKIISPFARLSRTVAEHVQPAAILSTLQQLGQCALACYKIKPYLEGDMPNCSSENTDIVDLIARQLIIPEAVSYISGHCCNHIFFYALIHNKLTLAKILLEAKFVDPNKLRIAPTLFIVPEDIAFCIPLHVAAAGGHLEMVRLLVAHGAQLSQTDAAGHTIEHVAAEHHNDTAEMKSTKRAIQSLLRFYRTRDELEIAFPRIREYHQKIEQEAIEFTSAQELCDAKNIPQDIMDHLAPFIYEKQLTPHLNGVS